MVDMERQKVTVLDPQPVKYGWAQPSLRRGGIRLHPVRDGVLPMGEQLCFVRKRDRSGQKLRDVVNGVTGYFMYTVSALESAPHNDVGRPVQSGITGTHSVETRRGDVRVRRDQNGNRVYCDPETGRPIRTCDMEDSPLPSIKTATPTRVPKPQKERAMARTPRPTGVPGATGPNGRITRADLEACVRAMAEKAGRPCPKVITPAMLNAAKAVLRKNIQRARSMGL